MTRASTEEQRRKGNSHDTQIQSSLSHPRAQALNHVATISETVSGFKEKASRDKLEQLYRQQKRRKSIDYVLFQKVDRYYRNVKTAWEWVDKFNDIGIEINFIEQWIDWAMPNAHFQLTILLALAEEESRNTSRRTVQNLKTVKANGFYVGTVAPVGYHKAAAGYRKTLIPNDKLPIVKQILLAYLYGNIPRASYLPIAKEQLGISRSQFYRMFQSPVYCGCSVVDGKLIEAGWEGCINVDEFQLIVEKAKKESKTTKKSTSRQLEKFWLKPFLLDAKTRKKMTATTPSNGSGKKKHSYYQPTKGKGQYLRVDAAHDTIFALMDSITINDALMAKVEEMLFNYTKTARNKKIAKKSHLEKSLKVKLSNSDKIKDLMLAGDLDVSEYKELKARNDAQIFELEQQLSEAELIHEIDGRVIQKAMSYFESGIGRIFRRLDYTKKGSVLNSLMPEGFWIPERNQVGTKNFNNFIDRKSVV